MVINSITPFDGVSQSWEEYSEMLDIFFEANDIKVQDRKKAVLLNVEKFNQSSSAKG